MQRLVNLALILLALVFVARNATAQSTTYDHNGSIMQVEQSGRQVQITYQTPRPGIAAQGATPGTVLLTGTLDGDNYLSGMARIFRRGCGVIDYFVYGDFTLGRDFALTGAAPILAAQGCQVVNNTFDGPNSNLAFLVLAPAPSPRPGPIAARRYCVTDIGLGGFLNMRTGPGTQWGVIDRIAASSCRVLAAAPARNGWQPVEHEGRLGWVAQGYLRSVE